MPSDVHVGDEESAGWRRFLKAPAAGPLPPALQSVLDFHRRPETPPGTCFRDGVVYAAPGGRPLRMWLFARADPTSRRPGVLFVHSGGWFEGTPFVHMRHIHAFAELGWVAATIEYRLHPEAEVDDALDDVLAAADWMRTNGTDLGMDPDRLALAGASAGGHLAAMAALTGPTDGIATVMMLYPMVDLAACTGVLADSIPRVLGPDRAAWRRLSPLDQVHAGAPPMLTIIGDHDSLTPLAAAERFHAQLETFQVRNRLVVVPGREHAFDLQPDDWALSFHRMRDFAEEVVGAAF